MQLKRSEVYFGRPGFWHDAIKQAQAKGLEHYTTGSKPNNVVYKIWETKVCKVSDLIDDRKEAGDG